MDTWIVAFVAILLATLVVDRMRVYRLGPVVLARLRRLRGNRVGHRRSVHSAENRKALTGGGCHLRGISSDGRSAPTTATRLSVLRWVSLVRRPEPRDILEGQGDQLYLWSSPPQSSRSSAICRNRS